MEINSDTLELLAHKLGTTTSYIVQVYVDTAWLLWVDTFALLLLLVICTYATRYYLKQTDNTGRDVCLVICAAITFIMLMATVITFTEAIRASLSPERYAIEKVLKTVRGK